MAEPVSGKRKESAMDRLRNLKARIIADNRGWQRIEARARADAEKKLRAEYEPRLAQQQEDLCRLFAAEIEHIPVTSPCCAGALLNAAAVARRLAYSPLAAIDVAAAEKVLAPPVTVRPGRADVDM
jgi:hypothetical protein